MKRIVLSVSIVFALIVAASVFYSLSMGKKPNVMLIVLDTTRADHLGVYGHNRNTSPRFDEFAKSNVLFKNAITAAPWTPPSVATMFTGLYPVSHGVMPPNSRELARKSFHKLSDSLLTLAEFFKENGYSTGGVTPNPWTKEEFNYNQGFDEYRFRNRAKASTITTESIQVIDNLIAKKEPFFMYVHYLDPHDAYNPPAKYRVFNDKIEGRPFNYEAEIQKDMNLYDGEILFMDTCFGKLIDALKERGLYDDMKIVIVGDHGEQFKERGDFGHGFKLHNEELHVPLFMKNGENREVDYTVSTVDVYPTLIDIAGLKIPQHAQGLSLGNNENLRNRYGVLSEIRRKFNYKSITTFEGQRLIVEFKDLDYAGGAVSEIASFGLFDRTKDYFEKTPIEDPETAKSLLKEYEKLYKEISKVEGISQNENIEINDDTIKQLKSLGYLQ